MLSLFKWLGGALFMVALAAAGYTFAVTWGESRPLADNWPASLLVDTGLLTVFAFHHSLFARETVKAWMTRLVPDHFVRAVYVWVASLLLLAVLWGWHEVGGTVYRISGPAAWGLHALQVAGTVLIVAAVRAIDGLELAGIRPSRPDIPLYVRGPYGLVRHPIYFGWVLLVLGTPHMTGDRLAFAVLTTAYLVIAMPWEERGLLRAYGETYRGYMRTVRWRILPGIY